MRIKHFLPAVLTLVLFTAAQFAQAASLPEFSELAAKCGPAVVNISAERTSPAAAGPEEFFGEMFRGMPPGADRFFEFFGGPNARGKRPPQKQMSRGSGFIISPDGYIVTNYHVVADGDSIQVTLDESNGKTAPLTATVVGTDEDTDLALLKVEAKKDLPFLKFGDSDALLVGEWLLAIGNPFALDHTVTAGILSAKNRNIHAGPFDNFLQTDASINPGNSGGPLLNMKGEVIGINTAIIASGQGIGFAIPSNMAAGIVEQIKSGKKVSRGWIGVTIQDVDENTAKALGMEHPSGALVASVLDDEPAAKAGIEAGDVITKVNGKSVEDASALLRAIAAHKPGTSVTLDVWRNGKAVTMDVTLGDRQTGVNSGKPSEAGQKQQNQGQLGLTVRPIKDEERRELKLEGTGGLL
ncbi:Do family serine endopeptidase, partial [Desulfovibrio sp.]|uniref:Do family serine endopeptidase n=1 Tax=Desulfovibrio sp. TaxID=885 RepID=UPI00307AA161